jgi:hypothetical protein
MALDQITLLYQVSPIILTGGIASNIAGGMLPLLALTNPNAFTTNLLNGNENFALDDAFGIFQPAVGGTLVEQIIAQYPFANLSVAANAIIRNPINVSMLMLTPMKTVGAWSLKQLTMTSLKSTLDSHNNSGGTYTVCTPAYTYTDMLMVGVIDVSTANSPIPQNAWRWDFTRPLVTLSDTSGAQSNLMSQIGSGVQPSGSGDPTGGDVPGNSSTPGSSDGTPSTSDPSTAIGQPASVANTGTGAGATSPWISQMPFTVPPSGSTADWNTAFPGSDTPTSVSGGDFVSVNPGSQTPPPGVTP